MFLPFNLSFQVCLQPLEVLSATNFSYIQKHIYSRIHTIVSLRVPLYHQFFNPPPFNKLKLLKCVYPFLQRGGKKLCTHTLISFVMTLDFVYQRIYYIFFSITQLPLLILSCFLYNIVTVNNTISSTFRQKLKTLQNESLTLKHQSHSLFIKHVQEGKCVARQWI